MNGLPVAAASSATAGPNVARLAVRAVASAGGGLGDPGQKVVESVDRPGAAGGEPGGGAETEVAIVGGGYQLRLAGRLGQVNGVGLDTQRGPLRPADVAPFHELSLEGRFGPASAPIVAHPGRSGPVTHLTRPSRPISDKKKR